MYIYIEWVSVSLYVGESVCARQRKGGMVRALMLVLCPEQIANRESVLHNRRWHAATYCITQFSGFAICPGQAL